MHGKTTIKNANFPYSDFFVRKFRLINQSFSIIKLFYEQNILINFESENAVKAHGAKLTFVFR
jgi:hypothetical protein